MGNIKLSVDKVDSELTDEGTTNLIMSIGHSQYNVLIFFIRVNMWADFASDSKPFNNDI